MFIVRLAWWAFRLFFGHPVYSRGVLSRAVLSLSARCRARWATPLTHVPLGTLREIGRGLCPRFFIAYGFEFASFGNRGFPLVQQPKVCPRFPNVECPPLDVIFLFVAVATRY